jgi:hypothetical protein
MTTAPASQPITPGSFLFGDSGIASALQASGAADVVREKLASFTLATRNEAVREVERISAELLDLNLLDVVIRALSTYGDLRAAGRNTIAAPDSEELVELVSHQITLDNRPVIDLFVDRKRVATLHLLLALVIDIQVLTAVVRGGRLTALRIGRCDADASVQIEGATVAHKRAQLLLPASIPLGTGVPLAATAPTATPPWWDRPRLPHAQTARGRI